jgi:hypothetical protein
MAALIVFAQIDIHTRAKERTEATAALTGRQPSTIRRKVASHRCH